MGGPRVSLYPGRGPEGEMQQRLDRRWLSNLVGALAPRMAGAMLRERFVAAAGALLGIGVTGLVCGLVAGEAPGLPLLVAPMGASAVLLFAVPSSPLAQPWSVIGGNTLSACVGVAILHLALPATTTAALAVGLAIAIMALTRCLHPPGGAAALLVALMGLDSPAGSFLFALVPVALNSTLLVLMAVLFHRFSGHAYPHLPAPPAASPHGTLDPPPQQRRGPSEADLDRAIAESGEVFDILKPDLAQLIQAVERTAIERDRDVPRCSDVMSRDVVTVSPDTRLADARALLLDRNLRILPVIEQDGRVAGVVGLRDLDESSGTVHDRMQPATLLRADDSVLRLIDPLSDGRSHAAVLVDEDERLAGLLTQTDLIVVLARLVVAGTLGGGQQTR